MTELFNEIVRLAYHNPELREPLKPLIDRYRGAGAGEALAETGKTAKFDHIRNPGVREGLKRGYVDLDAIRGVDGYVDSRVFSKAAYALLADKGRIYIKGQVDDPSRLAKALTAHLEERYQIRDSGDLQGMTPEDHERLRELEETALAARATLRPVRGKTGPGYKVEFNREAKTVLEERGIRLAHVVPF